MSLELVQRIKRELEAKGVSFLGPCGAFEITKRVAWELRGQGAGLIKKNPGQEQCNGFGHQHILFRPNGPTIDLLERAGDEGGSIPSWGEAGDADQSLWRAPFNDWTDDEPEVPEVPPAESDVAGALRALTDQIEILAGKLSDVEQELAMLAQMHPSSGTLAPHYEGEAVGTLGPFAVGLHVHLAPTGAPTPE